MADAQTKFVSSFPSAEPEPSKAAQLAIELNKNRELTRTLYALRGEAPPNDAACVPPPRARCALPASPRALPPRAR